MAIFKCKACGAPLEVKEGIKVIECEFCGVNQTLPNFDNEKKNKLYDRANYFRRNNDYDKAISIFEQVLNEDREDAEAYWSLVLCKYGIEYVDDPVTKRKVPTCHRTIPESIFNDLDYKEAIAHADVISKEIYQKEAKEIDIIQKSILKISQKEDPFDIFICYKETDDNGQRTNDSVIAQEIYEHLIEKGYKVFFSRITLEDKLGQEYEPYIYAALTSAKVMLAVGTKPQYYNAVWVKNEWSRFLSFIAKDKGKYLIPCYRDMDPYDMPEEFVTLQGQDVSKIGFIQDLTRGIDKIFGREQKKYQSLDVKQIESIDADKAMINSLVKRSENFLKLKNYNKAIQYAEQILDFDPNSFIAYKLLLLAEQNAQSTEELLKKNKDFSNSKYLEDIKSLEDNKKNEIFNLLSQIKENIKAIKRKEEERNRKLEINQALSSIENSTNIKEIEKSIGLIQSYISVENIEERFNETLKKRVDNIDKCMENSNSISDMRIFINLLEYLNKYIEVSNVKEKIIKKRTDLLENLKKERIYSDACSLLRKNEYISAKKEFLKIRDYKDVNSKIEICEKKIKKRRNVFLVILLSAAIICGCVMLSKIIEEKNNYNTVKNNIKTSQSLCEAANHTISGDFEYYYFGLYPQSLLTDESVKLYKASETLYLGTDGYMYEALNGYYYRYEPIKWKVLNNTNGTFLLISDLILDTQCYYNSTSDRFGATDYQGNSTSSTVYANNYKYSDIRTFLNTTFINQAFTSVEQDRIKTTTVDNSVSSTGYDSNDYACEDTQDKIFLLSRSEVTNSSYGFSSDSDRYAKGTDYAKARGLYVYTTKGSDCRGNSWWWLRSSDNRDSFSARGVDYDGGIDYNYGSRSYGGVRPALKISSEKKDVDIKADIIIKDDTRSYRLSEQCELISMGYSEKIKLPFLEKEGYDFLGYSISEYDKNNIVFLLDAKNNHDGYYAIYYAVWEPIKYSITYKLNGGSVSGNPSTYTIESEDIALSNPTKTGYTFLGWTGEDLIGAELNVEINKGSIGNRTYTATWKSNTYTITFDVNGGNSLKSNTQKVTYNHTYTLPTPTRAGYTFAGWYNGSTKYTNGTWKTANNVALTAKWISNESFIPTYDSSNNLISFIYGEYPQTIKTSSVTINTSSQDSRGYYLGSDGEYYAKVTAKPYTSGYTYSNGITITSGNTYYFKVEPIKWKVLYNADGTYLVMSDLILDSQYYYNSTVIRSGATDYQGNSTTSTVYANNYRYSDIRTFLNTIFINNAFTSEEQNLIQKTTVDNSGSSTGASSNKYACEDTQDKIFLLSLSEITNTSYGFTSSISTTNTRYAKGTDYAKARGLYVYTTTGFDYIGNSYWWLRSPYMNNKDYSSDVSLGGSVGNGIVNNSNYGVRPALKINLLI